MALPTVPARKVEQRIAFHSNILAYLLGLDSRTDCPAEALRRLGEEEEMFVLEVKKDTIAAPPLEDQKKITVSSPFVSLARDACHPFQFLFHGESFGWW